MATSNNAPIRIAYDSETDSKVPRMLTIPLNEVDMFSKENQVCIPGTARLMVTCEARALALNGSEATFPLGSGSILLINLLNENEGSALIPLKYDPAWTSPRAYLSVSDAKVSCDVCEHENKNPIISFSKSDEYLNASQKLVDILNGIQEECYANRTSLYKYPPFFKWRILVKNINYMNNIKVKN